MGKHILLDVLDTVHAKRRRTAAATSRSRRSRRRRKTRSNARADTKDGEAGNILAAETLGSGTYREEHHTTQCYRRRGSNLAGKESSRYRSSFCFPFPETSLSYVSLSLSLFLHQFCFVRRCLIERLLIAEQ